MTQMNIDTHRSELLSITTENLCLSVFICVNTCTAGFALAMPQKRIIKARSERKTEKSAP